MEKICFIGAFDKTDLIMYASRILVKMNKKVLIIDATVNQKAKYIVPAINPTVTYVTEHEGIDVAVGFKDYNGIKQYLGIPESSSLTYDYIFIDIDNPMLIYNFDIYGATKKYFVTSSDLYSLKKGLEVLSGINIPIDLTKIFFSNNISKAEDDYLNFLSLGYRIKWNDEKIYFPMSNGDQEIIIENQRLEKIKFKGLSSEYKNALIYLVQEIDNNDNESSIKKTVRLLEKGV